MTKETKKMSAEDKKLFKEAKAAIKYGAFTPLKEEGHAIFDMVLEGVVYDLNFVYTPKGRHIHIETDDMPLPKPNIAQKVWGTVLDIVDPEETWIELTKTYTDNKPAEIAEIKGIKYHTLMACVLLRMLRDKVRK